MALLMRPSFARTLFFVGIVAAGLVVIDSTPARKEGRETAAEANRAFHEGQDRLGKGDPAGAIGLFREAIANARDNRDYPLALGEAQIREGQFADAETTLNGLLQADSLAGPPNLAMARVCAKEGRFPEAISYYHRAVYSQWKTAPTTNEVMVRFELADLLAARNSRAELLAELLPLDDMTKQDADARTKLARLYLAAGSPARAAAIFRDLIHTHPQDAQAHEGLGEADFARGNYSAARTGFLDALRLRPDDSETRKKLERCDEILELDPMARGLSGRERYLRSLRVLQMVADKADSCLTGEQADPLAEARTALEAHVTAAGQSDAVEANLALATRLWQAEKMHCPITNSLADQALQLVLARNDQ